MEKKGVMIWRCPIPIKGTYSVDMQLIPPSQTFTNAGFSYSCVYAYLQ